MNSKKTVEAHSNKNHLPEASPSICPPSSSGKCINVTTMHQSVLFIMVMIVTVIMVMEFNLIDGDVGKGAASAEDD